MQKCTRARRLRKWNRPNIGKGTPNRGPLSLTASNLNFSKFSARPDSQKYKTLYIETDIFMKFSCMIDFASYKTIGNNNIGPENQPIFHMMFLNVLGEKIHEHKNMNICT